MGYWKIFWVNEKIIRDELSNHYSHLIEGARKSESSNPASVYCINDDKEKLFTPIGDSIAQISLGYGKSERQSASFQKYVNVFNHVCSLHSSLDDGFLLEWTGKDLNPLGKSYNADSLNSIIKNETCVMDRNHFILPLEEKEKNSIIIALNSKRPSPWKNNSAMQGDYGIYYISEDDTRHHKEKDHSSLGENFINLMLSNWAPVNGPLHKVCSIIGEHSRFFLFAGNRLNTLDEINRDTYFDYLKR